MQLEWRDVAPGDGLAIRTSLTALETDALRTYAAGADVLEIGSAYGYSTVVLAQVARSVVAVDPHRDLGSLDALRANLTAYAVGAEVLVATSQDVLPTLGRTFDVVWIDGDHRREAVDHDVTWARRLLRPTGTLLCHDYDEDTCPGVKEALDAWKPPPLVVDTLAIYRAGQW